MIIKIITPDLAAYYGIDLCSTMATQRFAALPQASFAVGDLADLGTLLRHQ